MGIRIEGFDELERTLNDFADKAQQLPGEHTVQYSELFDESFMQQYTSCPTIQEFFDSGGFKVTNQDELAQIISSDAWVSYIQQATKFGDWESMLQTATLEFARKKFGL